MEEADLTEEEKKKIWEFIYENSSDEKGKHDLKFAKAMYKDCMEYEGAIKEVLMRIDRDEETGEKMRNSPGGLWTIITYAE